MSTINSYKSASEYLGSKSDRPLPGRSTRLVRNADGSIAIHYHATDVLTYYPNGSILLNSAGYRTHTTKDRINEYLGGYRSKFRLYQEKGIWYVYSPKKNVVFADNMILRPNGTMSGYEPLKKAHLLERQRIRIRRYAQRYIAALFAGKISAPSAGDCFICQIRNGSDFSHIESHIAENYYVPSLLRNAMQEFPVSMWERDTVARIWTTVGSGHFEPITTLSDFTAQRLTKVLTRYLYRQYERSLASQMRSR